MPVETERRRWGTQAARRNQRWPKGGKAPASSCSHESWKTHQQATRWWIKCEDCEGRMSEGKIGRSEDGTMRLHGWHPPTWPKPEPENEEAAELTDSWSCAMCRLRLAHGTAGVITEVGKVCMICRAGPGKMKASSSKKDTTDDTEQRDEEEEATSEPVPTRPSDDETSTNERPPTTQDTSATSTNEGPPTTKESAVKGTRLTDKQIEVLKKSLTAKQWRENQLEETQVLSAEQIEFLEGTLTVKMWQQLWA